MEFTKNDLFDAMKQLRRTMDLLTPREREILEIRYGFDFHDTKTLEETGKKFGVTRERIRQLEAHALFKIEEGLEYLKNIDKKAA